MMLCCIGELYGRVIVLFQLHEKICIYIPANKSLFHVASDGDSEFSRLYMQELSTLRYWRVW